MKFLVIICLAVVATANAARYKRGYLGLPAYMAHPVVSAPIIAPAIARPLATSYANFQSVVMSHPVAVSHPVIAAAPVAVAHPVAAAPLALAHPIAAAPIAFAHPFPSFAKYGGYSYHH